MLVEDQARLDPSVENVNIMRSAHQVSNKMSMLRQRVRAIENENAIFLFQSKLKLNQD